MPMNFLKKTQDYEVVFSKEDALKELKDDERVAKIENFYNSIIITTIPVIPINLINRKVKDRKNFYICPIGSYKILILKDKYNKLDVSIIRNEGKIKRFIHSMHVHDKFSVEYGDGLKSVFGTVCWGNQSENVNAISVKQDWYWVGKIALDIVFDGNPENPRVDKRFYEMQLGLQYHYAKYVLNNEEMCNILDLKHHSLLEEHIDLDRTFHTGTHEI